MFGKDAVVTRTLRLIMLLADESGRSAPKTEREDEINDPDADAGRAAHPMPARLRPEPGRELPVRETGRDACEPREPGR